MRITRSGLFRDLTGSALDMTIQPLVPTAAQDGGTLTIAAQDATGAARNGGGLAVRSGNGGASAFGGDFTFSSGSGDSGGQMSFTGGAGVTSGGALAFTGGEGTGAAALGAALILTGGAAFDAAGQGGSVNIAAGYGGAINGSVLLGTPLGNGVEITDDGAAVKVGLWGAAPTAQATTAITGAAFVVGAGTAVNSNSTFGGYTLAQIAAALVAIGVLV